MPAVAPGPRGSTFITMAPICRPQCHEPEAEAEIAARDAPVALQPRCDTRNGSRRDDEQRRRGPNTVMPIARPAGSRARPPSALRRKRRSSSIRASISPPRKERQGPAERDTTPSAAVGAPSSAPIAMTSAPTGTGAASSGTGRRSERSTRSKATSVLGSRPTSCAGTVSPPESVTANSPSSDKASSAVTMSPGRQTKPLERER